MITDATLVHLWSKEKWEQPIVFNSGNPKVVSGGSRIGIVHQDLSPTSIRNHDVSSRPDCRLATLVRKQSKKINKENGSAALRNS